MKPIWLVSIALLTQSIWAGEACAEKVNRVDLEEVWDDPQIIVTARKIKEPVSDAPLSLTVVTANQIAQTEARSLPDLFGLAPNVDISGGIAGRMQGQISIRGISTLVRNIGLESGTSIYLDGVHVPRPENMPVDLLNVEQVEILRGPQGTEYGKNTIAGLIHVRTKEPTTTPTSSISLSAGNYDFVSVNGEVSGPLSSNIAALVAAGYSSRGGFYEHLSGGKDAESLNTLSLRGAIKFDLSDAASLLIRADGLRDRSVPGFFQSNRLVGFPSEFPSMAPHRINNNRPNTLSQNAGGVSAELSIRADNLTLTSISAWRESRTSASLDDDQEQVDFLAVDTFRDTMRFLSQELNAEADLAIGRLLVGYYAFNQIAKTDRELAIGSDLGIAGEPSLITVGRVKRSGHALFTRIDAELSDWMTASAGIRYDYLKSNAAFRQLDGSGVWTALGFPNLEYRKTASKSHWTKSASVSLKPSTVSNFYVRYAEGIKDSAFNVDIASSLDGLDAGTESAKSIEAGLKSRFLQGKLGIDLSVFRTSYDHLQVSQLLGGSIFLTNAGRALTKGVEVEATLEASEYLTLQWSSGLLSAQYRDFPNCGRPLSQGGGVVDCSGNRLVMAPRFTSHAAVNFRYPIGEFELHARADVDHRTSVYFEPTNSETFKGQARTLVDVRVGLSRAPWDLALWVKNLTDETYETYADDRSAIGVLRTSSYGAPRTFGLTVVLQN